MQSSPKPELANDPEVAGQPVTTVQKAVQTAQVEAYALAAVSSSDDRKESAYDETAVSMAEEEPAYKDAISMAVAPVSPSRMKKSESDARLSHSRQMAPVPMQPQGDVAQNTEHNTEADSHIAENEFKQIKDQPLSTFSIDVDRASYANVRRFLNFAQLPPVDAVRIEEMVNYFRYQYAAPEGGASSQPFAVNMEQSTAPWNPRHKLVRIGLKGR